MKVPAHAPEQSCLYSPPLYGKDRLGRPSNYYAPSLTLQVETSPLQLFNATKPKPNMRPTAATRASGLALKRDEGAPTSRYGRASWLAEDAERGGSGP